MELFRVSAAHVTVDDYRSYVGCAHPTKSRFNVDQNYINHDFDTINNTTSELSRIIGGLRAAVQKQRDEK